MERSDYIFGIRAILEAIEAGKSIDKVLIRRELGGELAKELLDKVRAYDIVVQR
ncbi:MAG: 23S rRNA (guanosine(2251)-2'-O)-methyltransferase RlmB, partial [Muribaculaceae bacterium]|nr:23S rRNA (guanosine(2251)-2'-O)-methyltransferase RlmB [Muribaculaceae bacterium]